MIVHIPMMQVFQRLQRGIPVVRSSNHRGIEANIGLKSAPAEEASRELAENKQNDLQLALNRKRTAGTQAAGRKYVALTAFEVKECSSCRFLTPRPAEVNLSCPARETQLNEGKRSKREARRQTKWKKVQAGGKERSKHRSEEADAYSALTDFALRTSYSYARSDRAPVETNNEYLFGPLQTRSITVTSRGGSRARWVDSYVDFLLDNLFVAKVHSATMEVYI